MFTGTLESALLIASLAMAAFSYAAYHEARYSTAYHNDAAAYCGLLGVWACIGFAIASIVGITFVATRRRIAWVAAMVTSLLSLAGLPGWLLAGIGAIGRAKARGGDWAGLAMVGSALDGVILPSLFGVVTATALICLFTLRRRIGT